MTAIDIIFIVSNNELIERYFYKYIHYMVIMINNIYFTHK